MARKRKATRSGRAAYSANEQGKGYAAIPRVLLESDAFRCLSTVAAVKTLTVFMCKWGAEEARGGRPVTPFHYSEAEDLHGIPRKSFSRGLKELYAKGFFDFEDKGGIWSGNAWTASVYRRSERWRKFGTCDFIEMPWSTSEPIKKPTPPRRVRAGPTVDPVLPSSPLAENAPADG